MKPFTRFLTLTLICGNAHAYETPTHAFMTKAAFDRSDLAVNSAELYARLGFDRLNINQPFQTGFPDGCLGTASTFERDSAYVDARGNWLVGANVPPDTNNAFFRCPQTYERREMPPEYSGRPLRGRSDDPIPPGPTPQLRFEAWLMRGVIREDDVKNEYYTTPDRPDVDPWTERSRVLNHFYSPVTNDKDFTGAPPPFEPSGDALPWALGEADPFAQNQLPDPTRGNHFSYMDVRRAYFFALTYKQQSATANTAFTDSRVRMALWSTTLKSLGHVVHLLQDQASPQHSRGEPHNHTCNQETFAFSINQDLATRTYENFINYRLTFRFNERTPLDRYQATNDCEEAIWLGLFREGAQDPPNPTTPWTTRVYPVPQFPVQRMFFTTRNAADPTNPASLPVNVINARRGLGDYANRGFYTQDYQAGRYLSPPAASSPQFVEGTAQIMQIPGLGQLKVANLFWQVPDPVQPGFADQGLVNGRAPIISQTVWCRLTNMGCTDMTMLSLQNYNQMADMLIPRSIAYSAGMINFFFRGKLEIEPIDQKIFAVLNQGAMHTVDANGYPRKPDGKIFGFEKVRLKVRNLTDVITESGTNAVVPQAVGVGKLVAVARYHRNACYQPELSGERTQTFATPPLVAGIITEPACAMGATRTAYQEISVSAPLDIASAADLPGGVGGALPMSLEKTFDFTMDPIPVNATDLVLQVVYRGVLGAETDGIAVGSMDVREPTIMTFWNNSDYYLDGAAPFWKPFNANYPVRPILFFRFCIGANGAERLGYWYAPPLQGSAMIQNQQTRIAVIPAPPAPGAPTFRIKATPVTTAGVAVPGSMQPLVRTAVGRIVQANREIISEMTQMAPFATCQAALPTAEQYWCNDPLQRRRSILLGGPLQPLSWYSLSTSGFNTVDVAEFMTPAMAGAAQALGEVRFNDDVPTLADCPLPPTVINRTEAEIRLQELEEVARSLGVKL